MGVDDGAWFSSFFFFFQPIGGFMCFTEESLTSRVAPGALFELCAYCEGRWGGWIYYFQAAGSIFGG
jgi:hypothetical protein